MLDGIQKPTSADGIAALGYADALVERTSARKRTGKSKITHDPAIRLVIVKDEPIAIVKA